MSWTKRVLRINLTNGTSQEEPLNLEWANQFLGQRGLGTKYLSEEVPPTTDALSPENKMFMITGPLTGTAASTAGRYSVVTKSPLTGAVACSNSGGFFGNEMKCAGWDMIVLEGKAPTPSYIYIRNDTVEILPEMKFGAHPYGKLMNGSATNTRIRRFALPPLASRAKKAISMQASSMTFTAPLAVPVWVR